jgi:hypothetical protein
VCSDLIACDIKHARMGLHDIYITASNEKFSFHPIPPLLSPHFFQKATKAWTHKATHNIAYFLKHNLFCITVNWNVVSSNIAVLWK